MYNKGMTMGKLIQLKTSQILMKIFRFVSGQWYINKIKSLYFNNLYYYYFIFVS